MKRKSTILKVIISAFPIIVFIAGAGYYYSLKSSIEVLNSKLKTSRIELECFKEDAKQVDKIKREGMILQIKRDIINELNKRKVNQKAVINILKTCSDNLPQPNFVQLLIVDPFGKTKIY